LTNARLTPWSVPRGDAHHGAPGKIRPAAIVVEW
jgi:hypothetical protein